LLDGEENYLFDGEENGGVDLGVVREETIEQALMNLMGKNLSQKDSFEMEILMIQIAENRVEKTDEGVWETK